ncbi:MAG: FAD/NAD(P)-binding protein [bacterium]
MISGNDRKSLFLPQPAKIVRAEKMTEKEKFFEISFMNGRELRHKPGQFVEVSIFGIGEAPISISSSPTKRDGFELCVREVGNLTRALHNLPVGSTIGVRGPFGNGFPVEKIEGADVLFIGGGIGLVPLRSLINYTLDNREKFGKITILFGCKHPSEILFEGELKRWDERDDVEFHMSVDRPDEKWKGNVGVITTLFAKIKPDPSKTVAVVVGPPVMYKFVLLELLERRIAEENIYMSLERRMKCGLGKCGHCQINGVYVCQDGPVFTYKEIQNMQEAI